MKTYRPFWRRKIRKLCWKYLNCSENNNNANFSANGEKALLDDLFNSHFSKLEKVMLFDVGANIGNYSKMLVKRCEDLKLQYQLHAFEPSKSAYDKLEEVFTKDGCIFLNNCAASSKEGNMTMYAEAEGSSLSSFYKRDLSKFSIDMSAHREEASLIRLDDYIRQKDIEHIDFLKMDVEGHELEVLNGLGDYLNSEFIDFIQFEYGETNLASHASLLAYYEMLLPRGFKIGKILPSGVEIRDYQCSMEIFQYSNYIAVADRLL